MTEAQSGLTLENACSVLEQLISGRDAKLRADMQWLDSNSPPAADAATPAMDGLDDKIVRRNQVLFCIGITEKDEFRYADIEALVRRHFPEENRGEVLNVARAMSELSGGANGILTSNPTRDAYMLTDPIFRMAIRAMLLRKGDSEAIEHANVIAGAVNPDGTLFAVRWV